MVNGTQVVGCGGTDVRDRRVRVEQFAGARVFRNFQDLYIKPHTECCYT